MRELGATDRAVASKAKAYLELSKPRIIELLLITTIPATVVAQDGWPGLLLVAVVLVGGTLAAGGANVMNQVFDRDIDRIMNRTSGRPLPTERLSQKGATIFGLVLGVAGFVVLAVGTTMLAGILALAAFAFYVLVYTMFLKRSTTQNIVLGGAAGAVPALIGWAAVTGDLATTPWVMFGIILFWTPPHFWALSIKYEEEYREAEIPMLPVVAGDEVAFREIAWYSVVTVGVSLLLIPVALLGWIYVAVAVLLGVWLLIAAVRLRSDRARSMRFFGFTNLYLAGVFLAMMIDRLVSTAYVGGGMFWMVAATVLVGAGAIAILGIEFSSDARPPGVSRNRLVIEVGITGGFAFLLIWVAWIAVAPTL